MLISENAYGEDIKGLSYEEMIKERDELLAEIIEFEKSGCKKEDEPEMRLSKSTIYSMNLLYLSELCMRMHAKFIED